MKKSINRRKSTYEINPEKRALNKAYNSLSLIHKSIYSFILDTCWSGANQYMIEIDEDYWSKALDVDKSIIAEFVSAVTAKIDEFQLAEESFNLETSSFELIIFDLKEQIENYNAWAIKEDELTRKKNALERKSVTLLDIASDRKGALEGAIHYLDASQRNFDHYLGWFPTIGFNETGQVYRIREFVIKQLKEMYPSVDINEELVKMFNWFSNPKNRRRTVAQMNYFIHNWLENASSGWKDNKKSDFNLDDELDKLMNEELQNAANE